jgi:hypothetical protein
MRYWLNSPDRQHPEEFAFRSGAVCGAYASAIELYQQGTHTVSVDEKTGMQALERAAPTQPMKRGQVERQEANYIRHGTLMLTANLEVATGKIICPTVAPTRHEEDLAAHMAQTVASDPQATWIFVLDQLNTHQSEALVRLVVLLCGLLVNLGAKGASGILKDMKTRRAFLEDPSHRIRFLYSPRHASWLNQIEIWFSILARRLLRRGSFKSTDELRQRVLAFIEYYNQTMAKPFRWTYQVRPLSV